MFPFGFDLILFYFLSIVYCMNQIFKTSDFTTSDCIFVWIMGDVLFCICCLYLLFYIYNYKFIQHTCFSNWCILSSHTVTFNVCQFCHHCDTKYNTLGIWAFLKVKVVNKYMLLIRWGRCTSCKACKEERTIHSWWKRTQVHLKQILSKASLHQPSTPILFLTCILYSSLALSSLL